MTTPPTDAPRTIAGNAAPTARPDYPRAEYTAGQPARTLCHALMAGTSGVRALGEVGLPKWPAEKPAHYQMRAKVAQVARYYQRTVQASVGMILGNPPELGDDTDPLIVADMEDVDGHGNHLDVFAKHIADDAINGGFCAILVDAPPIPAGTTLSLADEQALGLRPFWVSVTADRILSWIVDVPDWGAILRDWQAGLLTPEQAKSYARQTIVRQVVIHEPTDVPTGAFGVACVDRYRVLALTDAGVVFQVWEKRKPDGTTAGGGEYFALVSDGQMLQAGRKPFREIPLAIVYGGRSTAPFVAEPPLLALAELNLDHYQVSADRRYLMRLCHAPTLFLAGFNEAVDEAGRPVEYQVGPNSVLRSTDANAKAQYVAANPNALQSSEEEREALVRQMAALGMSFIAADRRGMPETATGRALDAAAENASHATVARGVQDGLEQALRFHAMYRGLPAPSLTISTQYASAAVDPQIATLLWNAVAANALPIEAFISYLTTGELPEDLNVMVDALKLVQADADAADVAAMRPGTGKPPQPAADDPGANDGDPAEAAA